MDDPTAPAIRRSCRSTSGRADERSRSRRPLSPLVLEQPALAVEASPVSDERALRPDHAMAGNDDRERVAAVGETGGTGRARTADARRELTVGAGLRVRDGSQRPPHTALKLAPGDLQGKLELRALAGEVLLELQAWLGEGLGGLSALRPDPGPSALALHRDRPQAPLIAGEPQTAERARHVGVEDARPLGSPRPGS